MTEAEWGPTRIIGGDLGDIVDGLRAGPGGFVLAHGGSRLAGELVRRGLVDELRLIIHPIALGEPTVRRPDAEDASRQVTCVRQRGDRRRLHKERTMTETAKAIHINQVGTVFVPVADQDRALEFYLDKLGFEKRADFPYGEGSRWIEVAPPGSAMAIALVPPSEGEFAGGDEARCALTTEDIEADHATLRSRGVDVDAEIARTGTSRPGLVSIDVTIGDPVPPQFFLRDIDGNRFLIVEPD